MKLGIHFEIYASYVPNSFLSMDLVFKMKNWDQGHETKIGFK